jgi:hypothetical protein
VTPIVLDLNGDGVHTLAASQGVQFDLTGTGHAAKVGWASAQDGLLVRDVNHDGVINDGRELFGGATELANGQRAGDGFRAMAALDSNHDGKLTAADDKFSELKLWVDANSDGKTDLGELKGLADFGIVEINLDFAKGSQMDNGNLLGMVGSYATGDGSQHAMADVWFAKDAPLPPMIADLLAAPPPELLGAGTAPAAATAHQAAAPEAPHMGLSASRLSADDDLLRMQLPLL